MKNNSTQILIDIQKKSGISIENVRDIKNLKEEIEASISVPISYNDIDFYGNANDKNHSNFTH